MVSIVSSYSHSTAQTSFFDERQIWFIFLQLCEGLKHLHEHGIIHRDLKPLNVFCSSNGRTFKIGDLGVSRQVSEDTLLLKSFYGTPLYLSPELVESKPYNEKTDIWSLGVILYELCALSPPFKGSSLLEVARMVTQGTYSPIPKHFSPHMQKCISWMLHVNYVKRPNIVQVIEYVASRLTLPDNVSPAPPPNTTLTAPQTGSTSDTADYSHRKHRQVKSRSPVRRRSPDRRVSAVPPVVAVDDDCDADSLNPSADDRSDCTSVTYLDQEDESFAVDQLNDGLGDADADVVDRKPRNRTGQEHVSRRVIAPVAGIDREDRGRVVIGLDRLKMQLRRELKNYRKMLQLRDFVSVKPKYSHSNYTPPPPFVLDDAPAEAPIRQPDESERLAAALSVCQARVVFLEKAIEESGCVELKRLKKLDLMSVLASEDKSIDASPHAAPVSKEPKSKHKPLPVREVVTRLPFHPTIDDVRLKGVNVNEQQLDRVASSLSLVGVESLGVVGHRSKGGRRQPSSYLYKGNLVSPVAIAVNQRPQTAAAAPSSSSSSSYPPLADYRVPPSGSRNLHHRPPSAAGRGGGNIIIVDENAAKKEALLLKWEQGYDDSIGKPKNSAQRIVTGLNLPSMQRPHTVAPPSRALTVEDDLFDKQRLKQHRRRRNDVTSFDKL